MALLGTDIAPETRDKPGHQVRGGTLGNEAPAHRLEQLTQTLLFLLNQKLERPGPLGPLGPIFRPPW